MLESDQDRWLTYAEAGELLGISAQAARMLAKRRGWSRRTPNAYGDRAQVLVPADVIVQPRSASDPVRTGSVTKDQPHTNGHDQPNVQALEQAIEVLRDQLGTANRRADDDRARADRAEQKAATLQSELVELRISERAAADIAEYASAEAADLRRRLDASEQRGGEERDRVERVQQQLTALQAELVELRASGRAAAALAEHVTGEAADLRNRLDAAEQRASGEHDRADRVEKQLTAVEAELLTARAETAGLRCQIEQAHPKPPRTRWRRFLRALGH